MILALAEESSLQMPKDPAVVALIVTSLVWLLKELFDIFVKPHLRKLATQPVAAEPEEEEVKHPPARVPHAVEAQLFQKLQEKLEQLGRLEQRLEDVCSSSMQALKEIQQTTRELRRDHTELDRAVAVGLNRLDHLEMDMGATRKQVNEFRNYIQDLLLKFRDHA